MLCENPGVSNVMMRVAVNMSQLPHKKPEAAHAYNLINFLLVWWRCIAAIHRSYEVTWKVFCQVVHGNLTKDSLPTPTSSIQRSLHSCQVITPPPF